MTSKVNQLQTSTQKRDNSWEIGLWKENRSSANCFANSIEINTTEGKKDTENPATKEATDKAVKKPARDSEGAQVIEMLGWGTHSSVQYTSGYTAHHYAAGAGHARWEIENVKKLRGVFHILIVVSFWFH